MAHWMTFFRHSIPSMHQQWDTRPIFSPPLIFNRTEHEPHNIGGPTVYVVQGPQQGDAAAGDTSLKVCYVRDDVCQQRVLHALRSLQGEVFCALSQLDFGDYMSSPAYAAAAQFFPLPTDLKNSHSDLSRGDFDLLLIHRTLGLVAGEIKAVGDSFDASMTADEKNKVIVSRIKRALKQLKKSMTVLHHLVGDFSFKPPITPTLILPNITEAQLRSLLASDPNLNKVNNISILF